jgi:hypothetical protein
MSLRQTGRKSIKEDRTMKKPLRFLPILLTLLLCSCTVGIANTAVQGSGKIASEDRQVQGMRGVILATTGDLTITLGDQEALRIEAEDNLLPYLQTQVRNGTLTIGTKPNTNLRPTQPIHYYLAVKGLEALSVTSNGNIAAPVLRADRFTAEISSNGDIRLAGLYANSLQVRISSSGDLEINEGEVSQQSITISSSGQYKAGGVRSQTADVRLSSSGNATIWVTGSLNAQLSSSGNVNYYGRPAITQRMSSSGKIVSLGDK